MSALRLDIAPSVAEEWVSYPPEIRAKLAGPRGLVLEVAEREDSVPQLEEPLKWGEMSYVTDDRLPREALTACMRTALRYHLVNGSGNLPGQREGWTL